MLHCVATVKPLNKGHIGDNINSTVMPFCPLLRGNQLFEILKRVFCLEGPLLEVYWFTVLTLSIVGGYVS